MKCHNCGQEIIPRKDPVYKRRFRPVKYCDECRLNYHRLWLAEKRQHQQAYYQSLHEEYKNIYWDFIPAQDGQTAQDNIGSVKESDLITHTAEGQWKRPIAALRLQYQIQKIAKKERMRGKKNV